MTKEDVRRAVTVTAMKAVNIKVGEEQGNIPVAKAWVMLQRTLIGVPLALFGALGIVRYEMNHYLGVGLIIAGATIWSGQVVTGALKALPSIIGALIRASRGEKESE